MQTTGYVIIGGETILLLIREKRTSRLLKLRQTGKDGNRFSDEEIFLSSSPEILAKLKNGETVEL